MPTLCRLAVPSCNWRKPADRIFATLAWATHMCGWPKAFLWIVSFISLDSQPVLLLLLAYGRAGVARAPKGRLHAIGSAADTQNRNPETSPKSHFGKRLPTT